jgi:uncharacterized protein (DUF433 family)
MKGHRIIKPWLDYRSGCKPAENRHYQHMAQTQLTDRITTDPEVCFGKPCIAGTRIRVVDVLDNLAGGASPEEIVADFPELSIADVRAALAYAAQLAERPIIIAA